MLYCTVSAQQDRLAGNDGNVMLWHRSGFWLVSPWGANNEAEPKAWFYVEDDAALPEQIGKQGKQSVWYAAVDEEWTQISLDILTQNEMQRRESCSSQRPSQRGAV